MDDDADDDGAGIGPPLPPDDRLWRHPSELTAWGRGRHPGPAVAAPTPGRRGRAVWPIAVVGRPRRGGALRRRAGRHRRPLPRRRRAPVVEKVAVTPVVSIPDHRATEGGVAALAEKLAPAVVRLVVTSEGGHDARLRRRRPRRRPRLHQRPRGRRRHVDLRGAGRRPPLRRRARRRRPADRRRRGGRSTPTTSPSPCSAPPPTSPSGPRPWPSAGPRRAAAQPSVTTGRRERRRAPARRRRRVAARPDPDGRADRAGVVGRPARRRQRRRDRDHHRPGRRARPGSASPRRSTSCGGWPTELIESGTVAHGWLGHRGRRPRDGRGRADGRARRRGRPGRCISGSPAARCGPAAPTT